MKYGPLLFFLFCISAASAGYGQHAGQADYNAWAMNPGDTGYVYVRSANIRNEGDAGAAIVDSLSCGTPVIVREQGKTLYALKNIYAPWLKVQYTAGTTIKEGYVWQGLLALGRYRGQDNTCFLYGLERIIAAQESGDYKPEQWQVRLKVMAADDALLDEQEWKVNSPETSLTGGMLLGAMGLNSLQNIVRIYFGGGACAVPADYYYYGWNGRQLLSLPGKMEVSDAGVYYHGETILFPSEPGGQAGKLIKLTEEGEAQEENDKNGEPVFKVRKSRTVYLWDGHKAILQKK